MAQLRITWYGENILRERALPVDTFDEKLKLTLRDMRETMMVADGVGLAGNQAGILKRIVVVYIPARNGDPAREIDLINPEITFVSDETYTDEEGCLSLPGVHADVERYREIEVAYQDADGNAQTLRATGGLLARCLQHEIDHLNGVLFIDRIPQAEKDALRLELKTIKRNNKKRLTAQ